MTNPDNVGGLPELPDPCRRKCYGELFEYFDADQMRAYGELCRAAPAGGDGDLWQPTPCPTCNGFCGDSGPTCAENNIAAPSAGSGEVERLAMAVEDAANVFSKSCDLHHELIEAAALLRKLQQGADAPKESQ